MLCIVGLVFGIGLTGRNQRSIMIAMFFVITQLAFVISMLIGAERSDRLADAAQKLEPTPDEAMALLEDYLSTRTWKAPRELVRV